MKKLEYSTIISMVSATICGFVGFGLSFASNDRASRMLGRANEPSVLRALGVAFLFCLIGFFVTNLLSRMAKTFGLEVPPDQVEEDRLSQLLNGDSIGTKLKK
jgi:hypothetical protein